MNALKLFAVATILAVASGCTAAGDDTGTSEDFATRDIDSMFRRPDGNFDVQCTNGTKETVTLAQLVADEACGGPGTPGAPTPAEPAPANETTMELAFGDATGGLSRAQFGVTTAEDGDTFHIEIHEGGEAKCPDESTPSPARTLLLTGVKRDVAAGAKLTEADGLSATYLDFAGELVKDQPFVRASAIAVTVVAVSETSVELEVEATFPDGTAKGRLHADFCSSLSSR
ncbi:MAG: hypothetical protein KIT84_35725 [Labilithrix sp.]|nr:hypothetical protein [Labilithrix sp.]MCW5816403.1 hypothetical protein [Labilithrix sp.]